MSEPIDPDWALPNLRTQTASHLFGGPPLAPPAAIISQLTADPDREAPWVALAGWLADNGFWDEADAVRAFWPAVADSMREGISLGKALGLVSRHAAGLANGWPDGSAGEAHPLRRPSGRPSVSRRL